MKAVARENHLHTSSTAFGLAARPSKVASCHLKYSFLAEQHSSCIRANETCMSQDVAQRSGFANPHTSSTALGLAARPSKVASCHLKHSSRSCIRAKRCFANPHSGFTLIEVLVAIAIFAVLSAAGWIVFDQLIKNRERNTQHVNNLQQLQYAYAQVLRDVSQMAPVTGQEDAVIYPALRLQSDVLQFNKAGVFDPLQQGLDEFEYIEYRYDIDRKALVRYRNAYIVRKRIQNMQGDVVLAPIENIRFQALDPGPYEQWPAQVVADAGAEQYIYAQLPKGIQFNFSYQGRDYRWLFSPGVTAPNLENINQNNDNNGNNTENSGNTNTSQGGTNHANS